MQERRVFDRPGADDDLGHARIQVALDLLKCPDTATHLHRHLARHRCDPSHQLCADPRSRECAVKVDHMKAARPQSDPPLGHRDRIVSVHRRGMLDALSKLHATPALDVDGGNEDQSVPLVEGNSWLRGSGVSAMRSARPNALNIVSAW